MIKNLGYIIKIIVVFPLFWMMTERLNCSSVTLPLKYGIENVLVQRENLNIFGPNQQIENYQLNLWKLDNVNLKFPYLHNQFNLLEKKMLYIFIGHLKLMPLTMLVLPF